MGSFDTVDAVDLEVLESTRMSDRLLMATEVNQIRFIATSDSDCVKAPLISSTRVRVAATNTNERQTHDMDLKNNSNMLRLANEKKNNKF